ncbi:MAG: DUF4870 domain-containing protein [Patescibacteria group bacterium]
MDNNMNQQQSMGQQAPQSSMNDDANKHKAFAILGYIIPILFFIPLLSDDGKKSPFAMFHANQQLVQLIAWVISGFLTFVFIGFLLYIFCFVIMIMGIISAAQGTMKPSPLIGGIKILKS